MNGFLAVFKRELQGYFATPVAYVFLVIFLFFSGYLPFKAKFFEMGRADLSLFFENLPFLFMVMVPSVAMRLWAEERRSGSIELLLTLPISVTQAVLGKFVAAWTFIAIALLLTFPMPLTAAYLGHPDVGLIVLGYFGSMLMAGAFLAVGSFFSAVSKSQIISFILSVVVCALLIYAGAPTSLKFLSAFLPDGLVEAFEAISLPGHIEPMLKGILNLYDVAYFLFMIVGWILSCCIILDERKANS
ncbi:ABC transporter permease [candidate division KSB3 bacterium]|uniref:ABC transporter permease n=1 Tax=candidate division KSB3 bacterium TaxID=2044937 RepID=A0A2G6E3W8_9BACT|nr:MAG: ABC transporter permease [candidate division KSB3 bacterium]PIE29359.1 MAG: ABC transporter permease [candidate division KSB3 bacterium]